MLSLLSEGFVTSLLIFALTLLFSMPLGLAVMFGRRSRLTPLRGFIKAYISIMRGTPLMRQLLGSAQEAVDGGEVCAALRFGHGEDTMPPSVILEVADPYYDREDSAPIAATKSPVCRT